MTLMSKSTIKLILDIICEEIKKKIASDILKAGIFSVQIDTTQDVSAKDQISVVLRYLDQLNVVQEKLFALLDGHASTGEYYIGVLKKCLADFEIDLKHCIGDSTDGASNMQGIYKGFSTLLSAEAITHLHTWCHAHVLNLVMGDVTGCVLQATSLFCLLNGVATFLKASYKRMKEWEKEVGKNNSTLSTKRIQAIGETRWWSKDKSLNRIFGSFGKPNSSDSLYVKVLMALTSIALEESQEASVKVR